MLSKTVVALLLLATCVAGQEEGLGPNGQPKPEPYSFSYSADSNGGLSSHQETGDGTGRITGVYTIAGPDGRERKVEYVADANGYRATVTTNEIGTSPGDSGDTRWLVSQPSAGQLQASTSSAQRQNSQLGRPQGPTSSSESNPSSLQAQVQQQIPNDSSSNPSFAQLPKGAAQRPQQQQQQQQSIEPSDSESQNNGAQQTLVNLDDIADSPPQQQQPARFAQQQEGLVGQVVEQAPGLPAPGPIIPAVPQFWQTNNGRQQQLNTNFRQVLPQAPIQLPLAQPQLQQQQIPLAVRPQVQLIQAPQGQLGQNFGQLLPQAPLAIPTASQVQRQQQINSIQQQIKGQTTSEINEDAQAPISAPARQQQNSGQTKNTASVPLSGQQQAIQLGEAKFGPKAPAGPIAPIGSIGSNGLIGSFAPVTSSITPLAPAVSTPQAPIQLSKAQPVRLATKGGSKTSNSGFQNQLRIQQTIQQLPQPQFQPQVSFAPLQAQQLQPPQSPQPQFQEQVPFAPLQVQQIQPPQSPQPQIQQQVSFAPLQVPQIQQPQSPQPQIQEQISFAPLQVQQIQPAPQPQLVAAPLPQQFQPIQEPEIQVPLFSFDRVKPIQPQSQVLVPQQPQAFQQPSLIPSFNSVPIRQQPSTETQKQLVAGDAQSDVSGASDSGVENNSQNSGINSGRKQENNNQQLVNGLEVIRLNEANQANDNSQNSQGQSDQISLNNNNGVIDNNDSNNNNNISNNNSNNNKGGSNDQAQIQVEPTTQQPAQEQKTVTGSRLIFGKQRFGIPQGKVSGTKSSSFGTRVSA